MRDNRDGCAPHQTPPPAPRPSRARLSNTRADRDREGPIAVLGGMRGPTLRKSPNLHWRTRRRGGHDGRVPRSVLRRLAPCRRRIWGAHSRRPARLEQFASAAPRNHPRHAMHRENILRLPPERNHSMPLWVVAVACIFPTAPQAKRGDVSRTAENLSQNLRDVAYNRLKA